MCLPEPQSVQTAAAQPHPPQSRRKTRLEMIGNEFARGCIIVDDENAIGAG